mmetsp:Transcript_122901/g.274403  ORF Transcript_122901/g.274403 Transcript_122901/m.274403 type:complete len:113 (-) Transcript_122901:74-412(-)
MTGAPAPPEVDPDVEMFAAKERHLSIMKATTHKHFPGAWLYGDYREAEGVDDIVQCANACEADTQCYHWNFHVVGHRCDLKHDAGGWDGDKADWITGHATRYVPPAPVAEEL